MREASPERRGKRLAAVVGEDWHPTIQGTVYVILCEIAGESWRVAAWGGDDFGLELGGLSKLAATEIYDRLPEPLSQAWLLQRGFKQA